MKSALILYKWWGEPRIDIVKGADVAARYPRNAIFFWHRLADLADLPTLSSLVPRCSPMPTPIFVIPKAWSKMVSLIFCQIHYPWWVLFQQRSEWAGAEWTGSGNIQGAVDLRLKRLLPLSFETNEASGLHRPYHPCWHQYHGTWLWTRELYRTLYGKLIKDDLQVWILAPFDMSWSISSRDMGFSTIMSLWERSNHRFEVWVSVKAV